MDAKDFLDPEGWRMIFQHPVPFFTVLISVLVIIGGGMWLVLSMRYQGVIDLQDRELANFRNATKSETGDEAKAAVEALEARLSALEPRRLTASQADALRRVLPATGKNYVLMIMLDSGCGDCHVLGADFRAVIEVLNGWEVTTVSVLGPPIQPKTGIAVLGKADDEAAIRLMRALDEAKLPYEFKESGRGDDVRLQISARW